MWDSESQRIGKQKCTPMGYNLQAVAELIGSCGLLVGFGVSVYYIYKLITGGFENSHLWLMAVVFGIGIISEFLYQISWLLAKKKGFTYDYDNRQASWFENGERIVYKYSKENKESIAKE
jgi:hypothetical protein